MKKNDRKSSVSIDATKILLSENSSFFVLEAYKTLRTNVAFSLPGTGCKCIGIVSANRGDGKSTIAANLAISLSQINKKVVLIDCDMRLPTIAQKFGVSSAPGLSNLLSGDVQTIPVIRDKARKVDIIPSGNIPPDPTVLISSRGMRNLIEKLKETYDYIIFDFPPITIVSDAMILSDVIDGYLLVVRHESSEFKMVEETVSRLSFANAKLIGFVYNGKSSDKKYYKRGKYSKYGKYSSNYYYYNKNGKTEK